MHRSKPTYGAKLHTMPASTYYNSGRPRACHYTAGTHTIVNVVTSRPYAISLKIMRIIRFQLGHYEAQSSNALNSRKTLNTAERQKTNPPAPRNLTKILVINENSHYRWPWWRCGLCYRLCITNVGTLWTNTWAGLAWGYNLSQRPTTLRQGSWSGSAHPTERENFSAEWISTTYPES